MYRAVTLYFLENGVDIENPSDIEEALKNINIGVAANITFLPEIQDTLLFLHHPYHFRYTVKSLCFLVILLLMFDNLNSCDHET